MLQEGSCPIEMVFLVPGLFIVRFHARGKMKSPLLPSTMPWLQPEALFTESSTGTATSYYST